MWFLTLAELFNSLAHQNNVINHLRLPIGGLPLGIMEVLAVMMLCYAIFSGGSISHIYPARRVHPLFVTTMTFLIVGFIAGSIEALIGSVSIEFYMKMARELAVWPIYMFVGYRLLATPRSAKYYAYLIVICGFLTATLLIVNFGVNTDSIEDNNNYNAVRVVWYCNAYAGMAAMLLIYSLASNDSILPRIIAAPLACYCLLGQCAPLHRAEWLAMFACLAGLLGLIPPQRRAKTAMQLVLVLSLVFTGVVATVGLVSSVTHRDFSEFIGTRLNSMLPTERQSSKETKAWDSRLDSVFEELRIWETSPLFGRGPGVQDDLVTKGKILNYMAFHHNGWASILAQTGLIGFIGHMLIIASLMIIGRRVALNAPEPGMRWIGVLAFMCSLYCIALTVSSMIWTTREAMLHGVICGMVFRCYDMQEAVVNERESQAIYEDELPLSEYYDQVGVF